MHVFSMYNYMYFLFYGKYIELCARYNKLVPTISLWNKFCDFPAGIQIDGSALNTIHITLCYIIIQGGITLWKLPTDKWVDNVFNVINNTVSWLISTTWISLLCRTLAKISCRISKYTGYVYGQCLSITNKSEIIFFIKYALHAGPQPHLSEDGQMSDEDKWIKIKER